MHASSPTDWLSLFRAVAQDAQDYAEVLTHEAAQRDNAILTREAAAMALRSRKAFALIAQFEANTIPTR